MMNKLGAFFRKWFWKMFCLLPAKLTKDDFVWAQQKIEKLQNTYLTEYYINGVLYGDEIVAASYDEAQKIADKRGRGEKVIGSNVYKITGINSVEADEIIAALNDRHDSTLQ